MKTKYQTFDLNKLIEFTQTLKVLYVEDNADVQASVKSLLENFFVNITVAHDGKEGYGFYEDRDFDLIISDIRMPRMSGLEMIRLIRKENDSIPIIVTTAHQEVEYLLDCIELNVSGYLLKPIQLKQLTKVIKQTCEKIYYEKQNELYEASLECLVEERTKELERAKADLERLVSIDPLTELYNRRYFTEVSETLFKLSKRNQQKFSAMMIDIDRFKYVNDSYGHLVGDKVLIYIANKIKDSLRESDIAVRFGGEEFIVLLPFTNLEGAAKIAQKVKQNIEKDAVKAGDVHNSLIKVTVSIGVAECHCTTDKGIDSLIHRVDEALYEAKRSGRDTICCYTVSGCSI